MVGKYIEKDKKRGGEDMMKTFEICNWSWRIRERWVRVNIWEFSKSDKRCHAIDTRYSPGCAFLNHINSYTQKDTEIQG